MSWKSALESSVPMDRAMKYVSTRPKKAFSVHGRTRAPRREARLIRETLRKPKPHTVEEQEQTRASITQGGGVLAAWGGQFGIQLRSGADRTPTRQYTLESISGWGLWGSLQTQPSCSQEKLTFSTERQVKTTGKFKNQE